MDASRRSRIVLFSESNSPFGASFLRTIAARDDFVLAALVTQLKPCPDYAGAQRPVDLVRMARARRLRVLRLSNVNAAEPELRALAADYFLVANYHQILEPRIVALPRRFAINFHPSPLPRYAGLRPFYWMAKRGETQGGVSAIAIDQRIDGGDLIAQELFPLAGHESEAELREIHFEASYDLLRKLLARLDGLERADFTPQDLSRRTYFGRRALARERRGRAWHPGAWSQTRPSLRP
jgi:methionyl-tRNA formyltransferase